MKKSITVLFLLLVALCGATGAFAQSESDFEVTTANGQVTITKYTGSATSVVIPATIGRVPVVAIGGWAFNGHPNLTSISIPAGLTGISNTAFLGCTSLTSILVDTNNTYYTSINGVLFKKTGDTLIIYPAGLKGPYAIPVGVTSIGNNAFHGCTGLTSVSIPASVTNIGGSSFSGCTGLASILVDTNNNHYASHNGVLLNKTGDMLITYPIGLKGQYAIPSGVIKIEASTFSGCTGLTSISIPASVTSIGDYAFIGCTGLTSILVDANNNHYTSHNGVLFSKTGDTLIIYPARLKGQYAIPAGVAYITFGAFSDCVGLTSVSIPSGVTVIFPDAFSGCTGLTLVSIPASVTSIGHGAFSGYTGPITIRIGANVNVDTTDMIKDDFNIYYSGNGSKAGVYTFRNGAWSYAAR
ncbi:hypothetical protein AGMMS49940_19800 [Spirochaetia bacterium]|nr:hypothetical protein AGMMS49940_19800 [Spirochaetia bacterium]